MFIVELNQQTKTIQVKTNDPTNPTIVAQGNFNFDASDRTTLIIFKHIQLTPDHLQELDQLLSSVFTQVGQSTHSLVGVRFPAIFDGRINVDKLEFRNKMTDFMSVTLDHLKYYPEKNLQDNDAEYQLITDKELILNYADDLTEMMSKNAFWAKEWNVQVIRDRINSATEVGVLLDRTKNLPCGFGRLFLLRTNEEIFGYLSDVTIDSSYQSKGLGQVLVNCLVGSCLSQNIKQKQITGTLCLQCAYEGSGALSAPKLYKRLGFEFVVDIGSRIAIFINKDYYVKTS